jgi:hypothetical protein
VGCLSQVQRERGHVLVALLRRRPAERPHPGP